MDRLSPCSREVGELLDTYLSVWVQVLDMGIEGESRRRAGCVPMDGTRYPRCRNARRIYGVSSIDYW